MKRVAALTGLVLLAFTGSAMAEGDAKKGEKVFKKCKACHQVGEKAKNKVGPILNDIIGREIASVEKFKYSKAFKAKKEEGGFVWDEASLHSYLTKPKKFIPKNKMAFAGLKKEKDRDNVIAYLKTFSKASPAAEAAPAADAKPAEEAKPAE